MTLARGGSKGVPRKNLRYFNGAPLLYWTATEALKSEWIDTFVVSTDDDEIYDYCKRMEFGVLRRPAALAQDDTPTMPALKHAYDYMAAYCEHEFDIIVELRTTNPFKTAKQIDAAVEKLIATEADVVVGVEQVVEHHPSRLKTIENGCLEDIWEEPASGRRQDLKPPVYVRNGSFYILTREALNKGILFQGGKIVPYIMPKSVNIDTPMDFYVAERMMQDVIRSRDRERARGEYESGFRVDSDGVTSWRGHREVPAWMEQKDAGEVRA